MELIYPVNESTLMPHKGRCICVVLHDGTYYIGKLSDIREGNLYLDNGAPGPAAVSATDAGRARKQIARQMQQAKSSAFFPFFNPFFFPFSAVAFAFPFFGFPFFL